MGDPHGIYDISSKKMEAVVWKDARRRQLRAEYMRNYNDPKFTGEPFDPAIQRYMTFKTNMDVIFKPRWNNFTWHVCVVLVPMCLTYYIVKGDRDRKENMYRSGLVSYRDRDFKFT